MRVQIPKFKEQKALFDYLIENKTDIINKKRSMPIYADVCNLSVSSIRADNSITTLDNSPITEDVDKIRVKVVANTANWIDSHMDMLLPDSAKRSINQRKSFIPHLHDHVHKVDAKIGEVQDIILQDLSFSELGIKGSGSTQAIVFITDVIKSYNEKVFNQYKSGMVNQHSIGLRYRKLNLAMNDPDSKEEFAEWEKQFENVINKEVAEEHGFFWTVPEIELIENSAVLFGSNEITPTLESEAKTDPPEGTPKNQSPASVEDKGFNKSNFLRRLI